MYEKFAQLKLSDEPSKMSDRDKNMFLRNLIWEEDKPGGDVQAVTAFLERHFDWLNVAPVQSVTRVKQPQRAGNTGYVDAVVQLKSISDKAAILRQKRQLAYSDDAVARQVFILNDMDKTQLQRYHETRLEFKSRKSQGERVVFRAGTIVQK